jgi:hypothetical protein
METILERERKEMDDKTVKEKAAKEGALRQNMYAKYVYDLNL